MATKQYTDAHNFGLRDANMRFKLYNRLLWHPYIGDIKVKARTNVGMLNASDQVTMPNDIIWRLKGSEFINAGTDYVHMPMLLRLEQPNKYGSHYLVGTGEDLRHKFRKLFINQMSHVVNVKKSEMDKLRTDKWEQLYDMAEPQIMDLYSERMNAEFISAFYEGHSLNVTEGLNEAPDAIGLHAVIHPNIWAWDDAAVLALEMTDVGTEGQCKTQAEMNTAAGLTLELPTADTFYAISEKLTESNIQKGIVVDGDPFWLAVINLKTLNNIKRDTTIRNDLRSVSSTTMYKNQLFAPKMYRWGDFIFLIDEVAARSWHSNLAGSPGGLGSFEGTNGYHNLPTMDSQTPNTTINVYGRGALGYADVRSLWTEFEESNFKQQLELAAMSIFGLGRNDWIDKGLEATMYAGGNADKAVIGANAVLNQSSAIFMVAP